MKYLSTLVQHLTKEKAKEYEEDGWAIWKQESDLWAAAKLVDFPLYQGQNEWVGAR
jgi:hypothetical protein